MSGSMFYTPGELLGSAATLLDAASSGWPTARAIWGRFICCMSGGELDRTWTYVDCSLNERLCFVDRNVNETIETGSTFPLDQPNRLFYNFRYDRLVATKLLVEPEFRPALLFRAYEVNDDVSWAKACRLGVNLIATDQVYFTTWASVAQDGPLGPIT